MFTYEFNKHSLEYIAELFIDRPSEIELLPYTFRQQFKYVIGEIFERTQSVVGVDFKVCDIPYTCYEDMCEEAVTRKVIRTEPQLDCLPVVDPEDYRKMRWVHDVHHVLLDLPFDWEGEFMACLALQNMAMRAGSLEVAQFIRSEIVYKNAVGIYFAGTIPDDDEVYNKVVLTDLTKLIIW